MEEEQLTPRQQALYEAYEIVAEAMGLFDFGEGPNGAHYMPADNNPFIDKGLICANCVFYEGGQRCEIVEGQIEPFAICKLWIIPESLIVQPESDAIDKAKSFQGNRSAAASYAAQVRWSKGGPKMDSASAVSAISNGKPATVSPDQFPEIANLLLSAPDTANLRNLTVEGSQLFTSGGTSLTRSQMPQAPSNRKDEFISDIESRGLSVTRETVKASSLKPVQAEVSGKKSAEIYSRETARGDKAFTGGDKESIIVSSDNFVMDGHHRWAAAGFDELAGGKGTLPVIRIGAPRQQLMVVMQQWTDTAGVKRLAVGETRATARKAAFFKACDLAKAAQKELVHE